MSWPPSSSLFPTRRSSDLDSEALTSAIDSVALSSLLIVPVAVLLAPDRTTRLASVLPLNLGLLRLAGSVALSSALQSLFSVVVAVLVVLHVRIVNRWLLRA